MKKIIATLTLVTAAAVGLPGGPATAVTADAPAYGPCSSINAFNCTSTLTQIRRGDMLLRSFDGGPFTPFTQESTLIALDRQARLGASILFTQLQEAQAVAVERDAQIAQQTTLLQRQERLIDRLRKRIARR